MAPQRHGGNRRPDAKLRMDTYRGQNNQRGDNNRGSRRNRNTKPSESPRRRELIHNARKDTQSSYWTRRLLEVEERDPNRWRHSGFKEMYRDELKGDQSNEESSRSGGGKSRSRSPVARPRSPRRPRSPPSKHERRPRPRSPPSPPRKSGSRDKSRGRPRTPTHKRSVSRNRSESYSSSESVTTCTDESCSVCSPNHRKAHSPPSPASPPPKKKQAVRKVTKNPPPPRKSPPKDTRKKKSVARPKTPPQPRTPESSTDSTSSSSESDSSSEDTSEQPRISLSERFGKMAQWSVDRREYDSVKMKITKDAGNSGMKVVIENDFEFPNQYERPGALPVVKNPSPERDYAFHYERRRYFFERTFSHDRPIGPDVPVNWDDPVNRYTYYKSKALLWEPEVSFDEYIKWETWWERFQEWLEVERAYYGEDVALDNARRERERDWESYRTSSMGRATFDRDLLPLPRNQPWNRSQGIKARIGIPNRKFVRT